MKEERDKMENYCVYCMNPAEGGLDCPHCGKSLFYETPPHHIPAGTMLNGRYLMGASLGEGGFGITYIARDVRLDMKVAVKEYFPNGFVNRSSTVSLEVHSTQSAEKEAFFRQGRERFLEEARLLARFSGQPGIVDVRDFFEANNTAYIVMEYLEGRTLGDYLKEKGALPPEEALRLLMPVMQSLKRVHRQGLIHRDISPDNIYLGSEGVKLIDFGAARNMSAMSDKSLSVMLKPGYAPEEQYRSRGEQGPWTDVYGICATLYKCITGKAPEDALQRMYSDELRAPSALGVRMDSDFESALLRGLSVRQKDRYQSIDALLKGINGIEDSFRTDEKSGGETVHNSEEENTGETVHESMEEGVGKTMHKSVEEDAGETVHESMEEDAGKTIQRSIDEDCGEILQETADNEDDKTRIGGEKEHLSAFCSDMPFSGGIQSWADESNGEIPVYRGGAGASGDRNGDMDSNRNSGRDSVQVHQGMREAAEESSEEKRKKSSERQKSSERKKSSKRRFGAVLCAVCAVAAVGGFLLWRGISGTGDPGSSDAASSGIASSGEKNQTFVNISRKTVTAEDIRELEDMEKLETLDFRNCVLEQGAIEELTRFASRLKTLSFDGCSGYESLAPLSKLENVWSLAIRNCALTDAQLGSVDFSGMKSVRLLQLNDNAELSDLSGLSKLSETLTELNVDDTSVTDFAPLAACGRLERLSARNNGIEDLSVLADNSLVALYVDNNNLTDISFLSGHGALIGLFASGNKITDIGPLAGHERLHRVYLDGNQILDLSPLGTCGELQEISICDNQVASLEPLAGCGKLERVCADRNRLASLDGLESAIELREIYARGNQITDISGLTNCTVLKMVYLSDNAVTDISLLAKSSRTLQYVFLGNNQITDISGLAGTGALEYLNLDHNQVTTLDPLKESVSLIGLTAENNKIQSMSGISGAGKLKYLCLAHNEISDMSPMADLSDLSEKGFAVVDLSSNRISQLMLSMGKAYGYLAVYNNPIDDFSAVKGVKGNYFLFSDSESADLSTLLNSYSIFTVIECPLDRQVAVKESLKGKTVAFKSVEEADQDMAKTKGHILGDVQEAEEEE